MTRVTLVGKPDCHLCHEAREQVSKVCDELGIGWLELSILEDPGLYDEYWEKIPVVLIDGRVHDYWRVDPRRLRRALSDNRSESSD
ncbi:MAG: glutaredoxin family protein [Actinobacteria bacterium]|nr:glutaredoxin family protein [Actinomycetota bacterium]